jgi:biopolymer transport protein TolQ
LTRSGPVGQTILAGLLILSLYTWAVVFWKRGELARAERGARDFLRRFRENASQWLNSGVAGPLPRPVGPVFEEALSEVRMQREMVGAGRPLGADSLARVQQVLDAETDDQITDLERGQTVLAIAASASPFVGLFGTVWGIMNAFRGMSLEGSAGIAAVAPGVAEALVTTVAGLAVAIPSVVMYNLFNRRIRNIIGLMERFNVEFIRAVDHASHRNPGTSSGTGGREPVLETPAPVFARRDG